MSIYLVQHGAANPKEIDPEKSLSEKGIETSKFMAELAVIKKFKISKIFHSGIKRARETAEIFSKETGVEIYKKDGLAPLDSPVDIQDLINKNDDAMIIGHLPFSSKLVSLLITESQEIEIIKFQNSCIICLDRDENNKWFIKWTLMPDIK